MSPDPTTDHTTPTTITNRSRNPWSGLWSGRPRPPQVHSGPPVTITNGTRMRVLAHGRTRHAPAAYGRTDCAPRGHCACPAVHTRARRLCRTPCLLRRRLHIERGDHCASAGVHTAWHAKGSLDGPTMGPTKAGQRADQGFTAGGRRRPAPCPVGAWGRRRGRPDHGSDHGWPGRRTRLSGGWSRHGRPPGRRAQGVFSSHVVARAAPFRIRDLTSAALCPHQVGEFLVAVHFSGPRSER
ncbi:hypothetical protein RKD31_000986 [Streptomyces sp. SAI-163]